MNYTISEKQKNILLVSGAVFLCLGMAAVVFFGLKAIGPQKSHIQTPATTKPAQQNQKKPVSEADTHFQNGDKALKAGDTETGIAELTKAQELYEQAGDVMKVEEIKDQISLAQYAAKNKTESQPAEQTADPGKTTKKP